MRAYWRSSNIFLHSYRTGSYLIPHFSALVDQCQRRPLTFTCNAMLCVEVLMSRLRLQADGSRADSCQVKYHHLIFNHLKVYSVLALVICIEYHGSQLRSSIHRATRNRHWRSYQHPSCWITSLPLLGRGTCLFRLWYTISHPVARTHSQRSNNRSTGQGYPKFLQPPDPLILQMTRMLRRISTITSNTLPIFGNRATLVMGRMWRHIYGYSATPKSLRWYNRDD